MIAEFALVAAVLGGIAAPHFAPLTRAAPLTAASMWLGALALRALAALGFALFVFLYLPQTALFAAVTAWCWHTVMPLLAEHLGLSSHPVADAATVLPGLALAFSLASVSIGLATAAVRLHLHLVRRPRGRGPLGSTVVDDPDVILAVTGIGRGRVVVSEAALDVMDSQELRAGLTHELGHLARRHRPLLLGGSLLTALGRWLPGTAAAQREFAFHLERDADEYALRRTGDPLALAGAICKAATGRLGTPMAPALGGRGSVQLRLDYLLAEAPARLGARSDRALRSLAVAMVMLALGLALTLPGWALAAPSQPPAHGASSSNCH